MLFFTNGAFPASLSMKTPLRLCAGTMRVGIHAIRLSNAAAPMPDVDRLTIQ